MRKYFGAGLIVLGAVLTADGAGSGTGLLAAGVLAVFLGVGLAAFGRPLASEAVLSKSGGNP